MDEEILRAVIRLAISLPLVAALAYLAVKYGLGRRTVGTGRQRHMKVVEQLALGPKVSLSLVQVGESYYLLAHQDGSTVLIKELQEIPAEIKGEHSGMPANVFSGLVNKWKQQGNDKHE
jgi:flagellar protein FliO/FliZ